MEWLTTGQMIDRLKVGEVAEIEKSLQHGCTDNHIKIDPEGTLRWYSAESERFGQPVTLDERYMKCSWRILPEYVSFEEARKAYKEGKTIECEYVGVVDGAKHSTKFSLEKDEYEGDLSFYMIIEGKWTIEE